MDVKIIGIGELLWDMLPGGRQVGGAPTNFAYHARALGAAHVRVISRVGNDDLGRDILGRLAAMGLRGEGMQRDDAAPTGTVTVSLSGDGIPEFTIHENVAWDRIAVTEEALTAARTCDAVCFGSLAQRSKTSRETIWQLVAAAPTHSLRIFDVNLRQHFYSSEVIVRSLHLANVLKLNDAELPVLAEMLELPAGVDRQITTLADRFDLHVVALTRGAHGSLLHQAGRWAERGVRPVEVKDTVGAGDAFTAGLAIGLLLGMDLAEISVAASEVARHVCSCHGATPPLPASLATLFRPKGTQP